MNDTTIPPRNSKGRVYTVRDAACPEAGYQLIRAQSQAAAVAHARPKFVASIASQDEIIDSVELKIQVETA